MSGLLGIDRDESSFANTVTTVFIPSLDAASPIREGSRVLNMKKGTATGASGVTFIRYDNATRRAVFEIQSGSYSFFSTTAGSPNSM